MMDSVRSERKRIAYHAVFTEDKSPGEDIVTISLSELFCF